MTRLRKRKLRWHTVLLENMAADMFTKPLQGSLFKKFRNEIMNIQKDASFPHGVTMLHRSVLRKYATEGNLQEMSIPMDTKSQANKRSDMCVSWLWSLCDVRRYFSHKLCTSEIMRNKRQQKTRNNRGK